MLKAFKRGLFCAVLLSLNVQAQLLDVSLIEAPLALRAPRYETVIPAYYNSETDRFFIDVVRLFIELGMVVDTTENGITARDADRYFSFNLNGYTLVLSGTYVAKGVPVDSTLYFIRSGVLYLDLETLSSAYQEFIDFRRDELEISVASGASFKRFEYLLGRGRASEEWIPIRYPRTRRFLGTPAFSYIVNWQRFRGYEAFHASLGLSGEMLFGRFQGNGVLSKEEFYPSYYSWDIDFKAPAIGYTRIGFNYGPPSYGYNLPLGLEPSYRPFYNTSFVMLSNDPITADLVQSHQAIEGNAEPGSLVFAKAQEEQTDYVRVGKDGRYRLLVPLRYGLSTVEVVENRLGGLPPVSYKRMIFTPSWFTPQNRFRYLVLVAPEDYQNFYLRASYNYQGNLNMMLLAQGREQLLGHVGLRLLGTLVVGGGYGFSWAQAANRLRPIEALTLDWWTRNLILQLTRSQRYLFGDIPQTTTQLQTSFYLGPLSALASYRLNETDTYGNSEQYFVQGSLRILGFYLSGSYSRSQISISYSETKQISLFRSFIAWKTPFFVTASRRQYSGYYHGLEYEGMLQIGTPSKLLSQGHWNVQVSLGVRYWNQELMPTLSASIRLPFANVNYRNSSQIHGQTQQVSIYGGGYMGILPQLSSSPSYTSSIEIFVFEDVNRNGRFDKDDLLRPDVAISILGAPLRRTASTFLAEHLIPAQSYIVEIDPGSISDPYLVPASGWRFQVVAPLIGMRRIAVPLVRKTMIFGRVMKLQPLRYEIHFFKDDKLLERTDIFSDGSYTVLLIEGDYVIQLYDRVQGRYEETTMAVAVRGNEMKLDLMFTSQNTN